MHLHPEELKVACEHEFKYCKKCDVVYCEKCKSEWVKKPLADIQEVCDKYKDWERQRQIKPYPEWHSWPITKKREEVFLS